MKKHSIAAAVIGLSLLMTSTVFAAVNEDQTTGIVNITGHTSYADADKAVTEIPDGRLFRDQLINSKGSDMALADARAQMTSYVRGLQMNGAATVGQYLDQHADLKDRVDKMLRAANRDSTSADADGFDITLSFKLTGYDNSLSSILLPPTYVRAALPKPTAKITLEQDYTGLIVDYKDLDVKPAFQPALRDSSGRDIYFYNALNRNKVIVYGMVTYTSGDTSADITGTNPMTVHAIGTADHGTTLIISTEDADRILTANEKTDFFSQCAVVFHAL